MTSKSLLLSTAKECGFELIRETPYGEVHFFHFYKRRDDDFVFVRVDLNRDQRYLGACFISAAELLERSIEYKNIKVAHPVHEVLLTLIFPLVASGKIKEKHRARIIEVFKQHPEAIREELKDRLGLSLANTIASTLPVDKLDHLNAYRNRLVTRICSNAFKKRPMDSVFHLLIFLRDITDLRLHPPGCVVLPYHPHDHNLNEIGSELFTKCNIMMLGEHKYIKQALSTAGTSFLPAFISFFLLYWRELRKSIRRHGIVFYVSDINRYVSNIYCKSLLRILPRVLLLDLSMVGKTGKNSGTDRRSLGDRGRVMQRYQNAILNYLSH
jgi:hypothetical protein